jgi:hypothetical protein
MRLTRFNQTLVGAILMLLIVVLVSPYFPALAQGLRRESGTIYTSGAFIERTAGAAVAANNAVYLDSSGYVQKLTSAQAANAIGIAPLACASGSTTCKVQITGLATAVCDGNVVINDSVGGTGITPAGTLKTLASTLALASGALTGTLTSTAATVTNGAITNGTGATPVVTGTTDPALTSTAATVTSGALTGTVTGLTVSGTPVAYRTVGRALSACTDTGTFTVLLAAK